MTTPGQNPFEHNPPPAGGNPESYNYFAANGGGADDNPLNNPAMFVRNRPSAPPRPPSGVKRFVVRAIGTVLVLGVCGGLNMYFDGEDDKDDKTPRNTARDATPAPAYTPATPTYTYSAPPTVQAAPPTPTASPLDAVDKGDCLKNTGTDYDPEMVPVACGPGTYQVLDRIYGTIDGNECQSVKGATTTYTVTYYVNSIPQISRSYVFCLKRR